MKTAAEPIDKPQILLNKSALEERCEQHDPTDRP